MENKTLVLERFDAFCAEIRAHLEKSDEPAIRVIGHVTDMGDESGKCYLIGSTIQPKIIQFQSLIEILNSVQASLKAMNTIVGVPDETAPSEKPVLTLEPKNINSHPFGESMGN